jgi:hypothetical protein
MSLYDWSTIPADNDDSDSLMNWAENHAPSLVNDNARQLMARVAAWRKDLAGSIVSGGTGNAYTLTANSTLGATYPDGFTVCFTADRANGGSSTLSVNGLATTPLRAKSGTALPPNAIVANQQYVARYRLSTDEFIITGTNAALIEAAPSLLSAQVFGLRVGDPIISLAPSPNPGFLRLTETTQAVSKTTYPDLNSWASGLSYPWGSDSTTFNLPPAAGYFLRFAGTSASVDPAGPRTAGSTQADEIRSHTHAATASAAGGHSHTNPYGANGTAGFSVSGPNGVTTGGSSSTSTVSDHTHTITVDNTGGAETRAKNVAFHLDILASPALVAAGLIGTVGYSYRYSTTTTAADPGAGYLRFNNATIASATAFYISETDALGSNLAGSIATWDSSTSTVKGRLRFVKVGAPGTNAEFDIISTKTDNGAWVTFNLTYRSNNGTLADTDQIHVLFTPKGDAGAGGGGGGGGDVVGPASATNNAIAVFDGTTGKIIKDSGLTTSSFDPAGTSATALASHIAASDPHTQYALEARTVLRAMVEGWWITEQAGIVGDNSTDCTSGITTLISTVSGLGGGIIFVPSGTFRVSSLGAIPSNIKIIGANRHQSIIRTTSATSLVMQTNGAKITLDNFTIDSAVTRSAGAFVDVSSSTSELAVDRLTLRGAFIGIQLNNGGAIYRFNDIDIEDTVATTGVSFRVLGGYLVYVNDLICRNGTGARPYAHMEILKVEDMILANSQLLSANNNLVMAPDTGKTVALFASFGCMFDDCPGSSVRIVPTTGGAVEGVAIYSPWIKGAPDVLATTAGGGTINGLTIADTDLVGTTTGIDATGVSNLRLSGIRAGSKSSAGAALTNVNGFIVSHCRLGPWGAYTANAIGLYLGGTTDNGVISGNDLSGNTTAFTNAASGTNITIIGNNGLATSLPGNATVAGSLTVGGNLTVGADIVKNTATGYVAIYGGDAYNTGAGIVAYGGSHATTPNQLWLVNNGFQTRLLIEQNGAVKLPGITTTASAANAFLDSGASNNLLRSTSSLAYKDNVEPIDPAIAARVLDLEPIWYRSKAAADRNDWSWYGLGAEQVAAIDPRLVHWGYHDDDYEDVDVPREMYVTHEIDGEPVQVLKAVMVTERRLKAGAVKKPDGVMYDRIGVLILAWLKNERLVERLKDIELRLAQTEARS